MTSRRELEEKRSEPLSRVPFGKRSWASLWTLFLAGMLAPLNASAAKPVPVLELYRPADVPAVKFTTLLAFGETLIPYGAATVMVSLSGKTNWFTRTDLLGRGEVALSRILEHCRKNPGPVRLSLMVTRNGATDEKSLIFSESELELLSRRAAEKETLEGNALAKAGRIEEALDHYRRALRIVPNFPRAAYNVALAYEKLGRPRLAIAAYADYLLLFSSDDSSGHAVLGNVSEREAAKKKVLLLAHSVDPKPPVPSKLFDLLDEARAIAPNNPLKAVRLYEVVESAAPWWSEGYFGAGTVLAHLSIQNSFGYSTGAVRNLEYFLALARPGDVRVVDARAKLGELRHLKEGLDGPNTIPAQ